jgi:hypothetical protein
MIYESNYSKEKPPKCWAGYQVGESKNALQNAKGTPNFCKIAAPQYFAPLSSIGTMRPVRNKQMTAPVLSCKSESSIQKFFR